MDSALILGFAIGVVFVGVFVAGFAMALRIRFWKARVDENAVQEDDSFEREIKRERKIAEMLDAAGADERDVDGQGIPVGPPPPMPGDVQRRRVLDRLRKPLGMGG